MLKDHMTPDQLETALREIVIEGAKPGSFQYEMIKSKIELYDSFGHKRMLKAHESKGEPHPDSPQVELSQLKQHVGRMQALGVEYFTEMENRVKELEARIRGE